MADIKIEIKLSENQRRQLWDLAKNSSQSKLFFKVHEVHVARESREMAKKLKANEDVCEIAGLFHTLDIVLIQKITQIVQR